MYGAGHPCLARIKRRLWVCNGFPACDSYVGTHDDGTPLGTPADGNTRRARLRAHDAFDWLWKQGGVPRKAAYRWLRGQLGMTKDECHIGLFDVRLCGLVVELVRARRRA